MAGTRGAHVDHTSGSSSDTEDSGKEEFVETVTQSAAHNSNSLEELLEHTETRTQVPFHNRMQVPFHNRSPLSPVYFRNRPSYTAQLYSYPIIDMRKTHQLGSPQFRKIEVTGESTSHNNLKFEIARLFNAKTSLINIIEEEGRNEEVLLKTIIVILPETEDENSCTIPIIIETFESITEVHPHILCARLPGKWKVSDAKKVVMEDLRWKDLVLCKNGDVIEDDLLLESCNFSNLEKIQAVRESSCRLEFVYQPRSDVLSTYRLEVDMIKSVKQVKKQFETHFRDEIQKQECSQESTIHFCFQNRLLEDNKCIGLILRRNIKEEKISIHFGSKNSIIVDLKFKIGRKTNHKLLIVSKDISTMSLRAEVSKHLGVDPKAVKVTFEEKLIDEYDNLGQVYNKKWCNGCKIVAGVKKCKTLRIRHPTECEEVAFEMYMLEPVAVLKRKVAEKWGLDFLQILLFSRGIQMENRQPLLNYPIKNNMEICLRLLENRIIIKVVVLKVKRRIHLIVDNCCRSTVDDLLRYCAHEFSYRRQCSRGIFKDRCLKRKCTLAEEGIQSGDTVVIAYFDQPFCLQGSLINVFMVHDDGHMIKRIGAVSSGLLLHAPKTAEAPQAEETCLDNGAVPEGINVCDNDDVCAAGGVCCPLKSPDKSVSTVREKPASVKKILKRRKEFLDKAREVIEKRKTQSQRLEQLKLMSLEQNVKPSFYLDDSESDTENMTGEPKSLELSLDQETGRKTVVTGKGQLKNTEVKSRTEGLNPNRDGADNSKAECEDCVRGEIESDSPPSNVNVISEKVKCIENCCQKIREVQSNKEQVNLSGQCQNSSNPNQDCVYKIETEHPRSQNNFEIRNQSTVSSSVIMQQDTFQKSVNHNTEQISKSLVQEKEFMHTNDLSGCETETSGCESAREYKPNIPALRGKTVETDSSDIDHVTSHHGEDCQCKKCGPSAQFPRCPYLKQFQGRGFGQRRLRPQTLSESALAVTELRHIEAHIPHNFTCPTFTTVRYTAPNADIETAGITVPILVYVAKNLGMKWPHLLRVLKVDETELTSLEYQYRSAGLQTLCTQALLSWKQSKGREASLDALLKALEEVGLKSVAENCQNVGYQTQ